MNETDRDVAGAIADARQGRDAIVDELKRRWLGPLDGEDEVLRRSPVWAYLVGTLYPVEVAGDGEELGDDDLADDTLDEAVGEQVDREGEAPYGGEEQDEDEGLNITGAFGWAPQSLGASFVHRGDQLTVTVRAGVYTEADGEADDRLADGSIREVWVRSQVETTLSIPNAATGFVSVFDGRARLSWRSRRHGQDRLTTVSVSNPVKVGHKEAKKHPELCLFQVSLTCTTPDGFLPYPQGHHFVSDEDREIAFRYRDKPAFAIGHGTAVEWAAEPKPTTIRTTPIPDVEVKPIKARSGDERAYSMRWLADDSIGADELAAELERVAADYEGWIVGQRRQADVVDDEFGDVARRIVDRQEDAAARIRAGIEVLRGDERIRRAFRLANAAMRWQMVRTRDGLRGVTDVMSVLGADLGAAEPRWRPFQLAFILSSLPSTVDPDHPDRDVVDLIWFPTGGGKTEAYLGLAAIEMIRRRLERGIEGGGTAVLTRYTMRLLTAQQFQRAATLICALELMRRDVAELKGTPAFTIGMWLGNSTTPGTFEAAKKSYDDLVRQRKPENPYPLLHCPWCGRKIVPDDQVPDRSAYGVRATNAEFEFFCPDPTCAFAELLPVQVVDEALYDAPPTMLVATVDKFARLAWIDEGAKLFGTDGIFDPPSLVIQDELHLLSGPLGTIVGIYEAAIGGLLSWNGTSPKVVASTATTRASERQVAGLMAKQVRSFPPAGLDADDSYFAEPDDDAAGRRYLGLMPQAFNQAWSIGQMSTELLEAPRAVGLTGDARDAYWTLVVYHNSLRELGRTVTVLRDDVGANLAGRRRRDPDVRELGSDGVHELNGNVGSADLVALLERLERHADDPLVVDALATTNIMSVGIDVSRLGLMLVNGHTKTTSEYIQATSRVGRGKTPGLVVTMFRSGKPRDRSVFESFGTYHKAFYRFVEPSSVTPWSLQARRRALAAALVILVRHGALLSGRTDAAHFAPDSAGVRKAVEVLKGHVATADARESAAVAEEIDRLVEEWVSRIERAQVDGTKLVYSGRGPDEARLIRGFTDPGEGWPVMNSMRSVDTVVKIRAKGERHG